tara:strand:- start:18 stop:191 length:174 start_codon:yes stop_codon:yes gene_type:complete
LFSKKLRNYPNIIVTADKVDKATLKNCSSKFVVYGGYKCHYIMIEDLKPISEIKKYL